MKLLNIKSNIIKKCSKIFINFILKQSRSWQLVYLTLYVVVTKLISVNKIKIKLIYGGIRASLQKKLKESNLKCLLKMKIFLI